MLIVLNYDLYKHDLCEEFKVKIENYRLRALRVRTEMEATETHHMNSACHTVPKDVPVGSEAVLLQPAPLLQNSVTK